MTKKLSIETVIGYIPTEYYAVEEPKFKISEAVVKMKQKKKLSLETLKTHITKKEFSAITSGDEYSVDTLLTLLHVMNLKISIRANNCYLSDFQIQELIKPMRHESIDKFLMDIYHANQDFGIKEIN